MKGFKQILKQIFYVFIFNILTFGVVGFTLYWTFWAGKLNWALLSLSAALVISFVGKIIFGTQTRTKPLLIYRSLVLLFTALFLTALITQVLRFINVFVPTMTEFTVAKVLVRVGIATTCIYICAVLVAVVYYLYSSDMLPNIWNGNESWSNSAKNTRHWNRSRISALILIRTLFGGGMIAFGTLLLGFIAWLFR